MDVQEIRGIKENFKNTSLLCSARILGQFYKLWVDLLSDSIGNESVRAAAEKLSTTIIVNLCSLCGFMWYEIVNHNTGDCNKLTQKYTTWHDWVG